MINRWTLALTTLALAAAPLAIAGPALATATHPASLPHVARPSGLYHAAPGAQPAASRGKVLDYSTNWSGYAVTGSTFSTATATWVQPAVSCSSGKSSDMSPWVGLDGFSSETVEQTGTSGDCNRSSTDYYAWYEMYPANYVTINHTVSPGDEFTATVTHTSGTSYTLSLKDITAGWSFSTTKSLSASDSSAEAVMEEAGDHLSKWSGADPFTGFTVNGQPVGSFTGSPYTIEQMEIKDGSTLCDSTSSLSGSDNFGVTWLNAC